MAWVVLIVSGVLKRCGHGARARRGFTAGASIVFLIAGAEHGWPVLCGQDAADGHRVRHLGASAPAHGGLACSGTEPVSVAKVLLIAGPRLRGSARRGAM
ncbi:MAG: QacE family quaternary ammonium compound efflux SMR transporter [Eggerthellaceae bacterium]